MQAFADIGHCVLASRKGEQTWRRFTTTVVIPPPGTLPRSSLLYRLSRGYFPPPLSAFSGDRHIGLCSDCTPLVHTRGVQLGIDALQVGGREQGDAYM
jgi:hypothetical protein